MLADYTYGRDEAATILHWSAPLHDLQACDDALAWCQTQPSAEEAWRTCDRPEWMFWLLRRTAASQQLLVFAACDCAAEALVHVPPGEDRPRLAIEAARGWARGEISIEEVRRARQAVADAVAAYAYAAAYAAADAAYAAAAAAYAYAADVADAYDAYYAYDAAAARSASRKRSAERIRVHFPTVPGLAGVTS